MCFRRMFVGSVVVALRVVFGCCVVGLRCVLVMLCCLLMCVVCHRITSVDHRFTTPRPYAGLTSDSAKFVLRSRANHASAYPQPVKRHEHWGIRLPFHLLAMPGDTFIAHL
jgi:hypothetical protein